jgi:hypothetical protein
MKYLHHRSRADDARLLTAAFQAKKKRKPASRATKARKPTRATISTQR